VSGSTPIWLPKVCRRPSPSATRSSSNARLLASAFFAFTVTDFFGVVDFAELASQAFSGRSQIGVASCGRIAALRSRAATILAGRERGRASGHFAAVGIRAKAVVWFWCHTGVASDAFLSALLRWQLGARSGRRTVVVVSTAAVAWFWAELASHYDPLSSRMASWNERRRTWVQKSMALPACARSGQRQ
jgi:hypothetical protein